LNTAAAVERLKGEQEQAQYRLVGLENREFARRAEELSGAGNVLLIEPTMSPESVRKLAAAVVETCGGRCAVFAGDDAQGYKYALGERGGNLRGLVKELNQALQGRGGGKPDFAQGSVQGKKADIEAFFAALEG
jgi:alanyl-tRNA synthetase